MEYFKTIFDLENLTIKRLKQIEFEEKIDKMLIQTNKICPEATLNFIFYLRRINRILSTDIYRSSLLSYSDKAQQSINQINEIYDKYYNDCPKIMCRNMSDFKYLYQLYF
jgi:hypothetical protein